MSESAKEERRQFTRVEFDASVVVQQGDNQCTTQLVDISVNGVLIKTPAQYHIRTDMPCSLSVVLTDETTISMQVALVHSSSKFLGFQCTNIDMESVAHLRKLIEFNLNDQFAPDRVLAELLKRQQEFV